MQIEKNIKVRKQTLMLNCKILKFSLNDKIREKLQGNTSPYEKMHDGRNKEENNC
jgi:hypothetical protein